METVHTRVIKNDIFVSTLKFFNADLSLIEMDESIVERLNSIEVAIKLLGDEHFKVRREVYIPNTMILDDKFSGWPTMSIGIVGEVIKSRAPMMIVWSFDNFKEGISTFFFLSCNKDFKLHFPIKMLSASFGFSVSTRLDYIQGINGLRGQLNKLLGEL